MEPRIRVFAGHFGSGKTEIAINYALRLKNKGRKVCIADIDIVNPYFCTRDEDKLFKENGIRLIALSKEITDGELGTMPHDINSVFDDKSNDVVLDVGGDFQGAVALGQYYKYFESEGYDMYFVVNISRPDTKDADGVTELIREIEAASRLKVKYLINNTNLSYETTPDMIIEGQKVVKEVSRRTGIPVKYTAIREDLAEAFDANEITGEILPIKIFMLPPWKSK